LFSFKPIKIGCKGFTGLNGCKVISRFGQVYEIYRFGWVYGIYRFGLLQVIWVTLISQLLVVLEDVENVNASMAVSVARLPMST
jgi:hypothetical protein